MKKYAFVLLLMTCSMLAFSQDEEEEKEKPKSLELLGGVSEGFLFNSGPGKRGNYGSVNAGIRVFPTRNLGFEAAGELGLTVTTPGLASPAEVFYASSLSAGPVYRVLSPLSDNAFFSFDAGVGGTYSSFLYPMNEPDALGYYVKGGLTLYPHAPFSFGGEVEFSDPRAINRPPQSAFGGILVKVRLRGGLAF